jgi:hypothetical protein
LLATLPFNIKFFGTIYTALYVNNNGNVTFNSSFGGSGSYTPQTLVQLGRSIIAPFWADIDTRVPGLGPVSDVVRYGTGTVGGRNAFGVNWVDVGYFTTHAEKLVSAQLVLIDRSDITSGDFDMEFNYCKVEWEAGDVSGGCEGYWTGFDCNKVFYGGNSARAGFASANGSFFEFTGSGSAGGFLDSNLATGLIYNSFNNSNLGRYLFQFRNGIPLQTP